MSQQQNCLCNNEQPQQIIYLCIESNCQYIRTVCNNCSHRHKGHQKVTYLDNQSYNKLVQSQNSDQIAKIEMTMKSLVQRLQNAKNTIADNIEGITQIVGQSFERKVKQKLQFIMNSLNKKQAKQIRSLIMSHQTTGENLNLITSMMRELKIRELSNSMFVRKIKEYMEENMQIFQAKISQQIEQFRNSLINQLEKMESLPSQGIAEAIKQAEEEQRITILKQNQQTRYKFLNAFGQKKSIEEYVEIGEIQSDSDLQQYWEKCRQRKSWTLKQWIESGKTCQEIRDINLSSTNLQIVSKYLQQYTYMHNTFAYLILNTNGLFPNLVHLELDENKIQDVEPLKALTQLKVLHLWSNNISQIGALSSLTNLVKLDLECNSISHVGALSSLTNLVQLDLGGNSISHVGALSSLTNLVKLDLGYNPIKSLANIHQLNKLKELTISTNEFENPELENQKIEILKENNCKISIK